MNLFSTHNANRGSRKESTKKKKKNKVGELGEEKTTEINSKTTFLHPLYRAD
jgi:hypothetical protein